MCEKEEKESGSWLTNCLVAWKINASLPQPQPQHTSFPLSEKRKLTLQYTACTYVLLPTLTLEHARTASLLVQVEQTGIEEGGGVLHIIFFGLLWLQDAS